MASLAIGIDFGTTKSHLAFIPRNVSISDIPEIATYNPALHLVPNEKNFPDYRIRQDDEIQPVPTVVSVKKLAKSSNANKYIFRCGYRALDLSTDDFNDYLIIDRIKRYMGEESLGRQRFSLEPDGLAATLIHTLVTGAVELNEYEFDNLGVTITVPAKSDLLQRMATQFAAGAAGFKGEIYVLEEPVSAFLFHKHNQQKDGRFHAPHGPKYALVFDFGGGTCDLAVVRYQENKLPVVISRAMGEFGGEEIDNMFVEKFWLDPKRKNHLPFSLSDWKKDKRINKSLLLRYARKEKEDLKTSESVNPQVRDFHPDHVGYHSTPVVHQSDLLDLLRKDENEITASLNGIQSTDTIFGHIRALLSAVLREGNLERKQLDKLIFAGGSSHLLGVRDLVETWLTNDVSNTKLNPRNVVFSYLETSVALGASIHQYYRHSPDVKLREVVAPTLSSNIDLIYSDGMKEQREILGHAGDELPINRRGYISSKVIFRSQQHGTRELSFALNNSGTSLGEQKVQSAYAFLVKYLINEYGFPEDVVLVPLSKLFFWKWRQSVRIKPVEEYIPLLDRFLISNRKRLSQIRKDYNISVD